MTVVNAIVCAYWKSRLENLRTIVTDLSASSRPPDKIFILNNNKDFKIDIKADNVYIINSEFNSRTRGKFILSLLEVADYYLLLDDDTSVRKHTIKKFLSVAHRNSCYGYCGVNYATGNGVRFYPQKVTEETEVDYFLGCGIFLSFTALVRLLIAEERVRVPYDWPHQGDDILIGLANTATIIPMHKTTENFRDLSWREEAMSWGSDGVTKGGTAYLQMRSKFAKLAMDVLKKNPIPKI